MTIRRRLSIGVVAALVTLPVMADQVRDVRAYIPAFVSDDNPKLGLNAATVLNLSIWRTLRKAPTPNPDHLSFGNGTVHWSREALAGARALSFADQIPAQLVLWGEALPYGDGVVVNAHLNVRAASSAEAARQRWNVVLPIMGKMIQVSADLLPERAVAFKPLAIKGELLTEYEQPDILSIYETRDWSTVVGRVGDSFLADEQGPGYAHVTAGALKGFLKLPKTAKGSFAVSNFTAGVFRLLRSDLDGADQLLRKAEQDAETPTSVAIDAKLMRAYCREQAGMDGRDLIREALALNADATRSHVFEAMTYFSRIAASIKAGAAGDALSPLMKTLNEAIAAAATGLDSGDPWLISARAASEALAKAYAGRSSG